MLRPFSTEQSSDTLENSWYGFSSLQWQINWHCLGLWQWFYYSIKVKIGSFSWCKTDLISGMFHPLLEACVDLVPCTLLFRIQYYLSLSLLHKITILWEAKSFLKCPWLKMYLWLMILYWINIIFVSRASMYILNALKE